GMGGIMRTATVVAIGALLALSACNSGAPPPPPPPVPAAPTGIAAVAGDAKVTLTWNAASGATSYNVYWATATGVGKGTGTRIANVSSPHVHQGLANGTTYYYVVTAGNASGESDASQEVSSRPQLLHPTLSIVLGSVNQSDGITLDSGGDADTSVVVAGSPPQEARTSGNGKALPATDGNSVPDLYVQFNVEDVRFYAGSPTAHVQVEVEYLDQGTDTFSIQYDGTPSAGGDGRFLGGGAVAKTGTGVFRTAVFNLCDAYFANRDNGADFRISDNGDGSEIIRAVRVMGLPSGTRTVLVDHYGANPLDDVPDSAAIQSALDSTCSLDTVVFTSPGGDPAYRGYLIDGTLFLTGMSAKHGLTFTASDPSDHALLKATPTLKGFVVRLFARSRFQDAGYIDDVDFGFIDVDGNRNARACGSNWGSWLPECSVPGDPWCAPGNIAMDGALDVDAAQDYQAYPSLWTTGVVLHDLVNRQIECGTALAFGGAAGTIRGVTIDSAGDHVHVGGCTNVDEDGDWGGWSDGITLSGPGHRVVGNTVVDPSDVGIVYFGGKNTIISGNTVRITQGNHGAFAGIAVHSWGYGDTAGTQLVGNTVTSEGDVTCGGLHTGINVGPHMWGGGCVQTSLPSAVGNGTCASEPVQPLGAWCNGGACQIWTSVPTGATLTIGDNLVTGAHINHLIEGLDLVGQLNESNNLSQAPRLSDWEAAKKGCMGVTWGPMDKVAHHPSLPGWTDLRIHCER
ncbi:MAG: hypothetical protein H6Q28_1270, partial [Bacteroidetes bacterium]|nr:hypothetical protein [Bacteroidota bacterium]